MVPPAEFLGETMAVEGDIRKGTAYGALAFGGAASLTPRVFAAMYGLPDEPYARNMTRLWGTRTAVLGAWRWA